MAEDQPKGGGAKDKGGSAKDKAGFYVMVVGLFMAIFDIQVVSSSLQHIQGGIAASSDGIVWVQTAYLVAEVVMIPLSGFLARVMSTRYLFMASCAGFTLSSIGCAMAWDLPSMIAFRVCQGFLGGAMIPLAFAANFKVFSPEQQGFGVVILGLTANLGPTLGPTVGGWLTETYSWHWLFLVNVVPGVIVTIAVFFLVDVDKPNWRLIREIDLPGVLLIAGFLGCLQIVLDEGPRHEWLDDPLVFYSVFISSISCVLLIWRELTIAKPIVDLHVFANRNFLVGSLFMFFLGFGLYGQTYILPQVLNQVRGYNPFQIGQVMVVTGIAMICSSIVAGQLAKRIDPRWIMGAGFAFFAAGCFANTGMTNQVAFWELALPQVLRGIGAMLAFVPITTVAMGTLRHEQVGQASGLFNVMRNMGGAIGLSLINAFWDWRYDLHWWWLIDEVSSSRLAVARMLQDARDQLGPGADLSDARSAVAQAVGRTVQIESTVMAWNDIFFMLAVLFVIALCFFPFVSRPKGPVQAEG